MNIFTNFFSGMLSVLTASSAPKWQGASCDSLAKNIEEYCVAVGKDIKRVQNKLKAEAHDRKR